MTTMKRMVETGYDIPEGNLFGAMQNREGIGATRNIPAILTYTTLQATAVQSQDGIIEAYAPSVASLAPSPAVTSTAPLSTIASALMPELAPQHSILMNLSQNVLQDMFRLAAANPERCSTAAMSKRCLDAPSGNTQTSDHDCDAY